MKPTHAQLAFAAAFWLALGSTLAAGGQTVAQPPPAGESPPGVLQEPTDPGGALLQPAVTAERHGRLLVLTYGLRSARGGLSSNVGPRGERPTFAVFKDRRPIASGQFEYG
jgi:hypothetical protein